MQSANRGIAAAAQEQRMVDARAAIDALMPSILASLDQPRIYELDPEPASSSSAQEMK
jgi:hypothetical protein